MLKFFSQNKRIVPIGFLVCSQFSSAIFAKSHAKNSSLLKWKQQIICEHCEHKSFSALQDDFKKTFQFSPNDIKDSKMFKLLQYNSLLLGLLCMNLACDRDSSKPDDHTEGHRPEGDNNSGTHSKKPETGGGSEQKPEKKDPPKGATESDDEKGPTSETDLSDVDKAKWLKEATEKVCNDKKFHDLQKSEKDRLEFSQDPRGNLELNVIQYGEMLFGMICDKSSGPEEILKKSDEVTLYNNRTLHSEPFVALRPTNLKNPQFTAIIPVEENLFGNHSKTDFSEVPAVIVETEDDRIVSKTPPAIEFKPLEMLEDEKSKDSNKEAVEEEFVVAGEKEPKDPVPLTPEKVDIKPEVVEVKTEIEPEPVVEITRGNPLPRAKFAKEDLKELKSFFATKTANLKKGFKKFAEIFQFENFRAVPIQTPKDPSEPHQILLLAYDIVHLEKTLNYFAALAQFMSEDSSNDSHLSRDLFSLSVVSLKYKVSSGVVSNRQSGKIVVNIDTLYSSFIKQIPLDSKVEKFWPEALQLEFTFGKERFLFIFPSVISFKKNLDLDLLEGKILFQTPWILRALEGKPLSAIWQTVSDSQVQVSEQYATQEELYRYNLHNLFEAVWDERSDFFPNGNAFRIIDTFDSRSKNYRGAIYLGYEDLNLPTVGSIKLQLSKFNSIPQFTFENNIHLTKGN